MYPSAHRLIAAAILVVNLVLSGCLPANKSAENAPRYPKHTHAPGVITSTPSIRYLSTPTPRQTVSSRLWPLPFSYGEPATPPTPIPSPLPPIPAAWEGFNVALLGSDQRANENGFRTDVIIVASIHYPSDQVVLLSVPRDLYVYLPGYSMQRVNAAFAIGEKYHYPGGGPGMFADTIEYNLGIPIHGYAKVNMGGFEAIIDRLQGVQVDVACPYTDWRLKALGLDPQKRDNWALYTVPAGLIEMDGDLALWYARSRQRSSDFDRSRRQQEVLRAVFERLIHLNTLPQIPALFEEARGTIETDIQLTEILQMAGLAARLDQASIRSRFIGRDEVRSWRIPRSGAQVLLPETLPLQRLLTDTFNLMEKDPLIPLTRTTVEIINASGMPEWGSLAAARLEYSEINPFPRPNPSPDTRPTELVDHDRQPEGSAEELAALLGLTGAQISRQPDPESPFDFTLILGPDYDPCFNPTRNQVP